MATEIELKLALTVEIAARFAEHPCVASIRPEVVFLKNTYVDTPTLELKARKIALRLRQSGGQSLQTIKTAGTAAANGLSVRQEWETPARSDGFYFEHLEDPELRAFLTRCQPRLTPIFTTDFQRDRWILTQGDARIEVALDRGHIESQGLRTPLCELELELLSGPPEALSVLAESFRSLLPMQPSALSKAARGYQLFAQACR